MSRHKRARRRRQGRARPWRALERERLALRLAGLAWFDRARVSGEASAAYMDEADAAKARLDALSAATSVQRYMLEQLEAMYRSLAIECGINAIYETAQGLALYADGCGT